MFILVAGLILGQALPSLDPMAACRAAVHGNLSAAVSACAVPAGAGDIWSGGPAPTSACSAALSAGRQAGKFGPGLPMPMRSGLVRDFDKKDALCASPTPPEAKTKERPMVQLWD